jgi:hypothetical protein
MTAWRAAVDEPRRPSILPVTAHIRPSLTAEAAKRGAKCVGVFESVIWMLSESLKNGGVINPHERVRACAIMWKLNIRLTSSGECDGFGVPWFASSPASTTWLTRTAPDRQANHRFTKMARRGVEAVVGRPGNEIVLGFT